MRSAWQERKRQARPDLLFQKIPLLICGDEAESRTEAEAGKINKRVLKSSK